MQEELIHTDTVAGLDTISVSKPDTNAISRSETVPTPETFADSVYQYEMPVSSAYFDSISTIKPHQDTIDVLLTYQGKEILQKPKEMDAIFLVFLTCFLMISFAFGRGRQMIITLISNLFRAKSRQSIFLETTGNDLFNRLLLITPAILLSAIFTYIWFMHDNTQEPLALKSLVHIGSFSVLITGYLLYKWITNIIVSFVFFDPLAYKQWVVSWTSLISFHGLIIFIPLLFLFYLPESYTFCFYLIVLWFFISRLIIIYKSYVIFFNNTDSLHYLFLYLCAQEIIPLFALYKGLAYIFNVVETSALWV